MAQLLLIWLSLAVAAPTRSPSFAEFDQRAQAGERLNVVFFGASLTWGANACDPNRTSYRARVAERLEAKYPQARFKFYDAAIGGTGSQLGVFRIDRDVLARRPDLVFVDFSANDDIYSENRETLASYEAILHRLVSEARCPVVQVIFPFKWDVARKTTDGMKRRDAHLAISRAYNTPVGDAIALAIERVGNGTTSLERLWPVDGVHPCDEGYVLFADAAWAALQGAVGQGQVCRVAQPMLYGEAYLKSVRMPLVKLGPLPAGWKAGKPNVSSAYFDFLMSRWLDSETIASRPSPAQSPEPATPEAKAPDAKTPEPFRAQFRGSMVMFFGETTKTSGKYRVRIDGQVVRYRLPKSTETLDLFDAGQFARRTGGNGHHAQVIATGLDMAATHTLAIEPVLEPGEELRLESICVAGKEAAVEPIR